MDTNARDYLLHVTYPSGQTRTLAFPTLFERGLMLILLASHRVVVRLGEAA